MSVRLWDVKTRKQIAMSQNHTAVTEAVALSPDGTLLASGHRDGVVTLWDMQTQELLTILRNHTAAVLSVAFSPDWGPACFRRERKNTTVGCPNERADRDLYDA